MALKEHMITMAQIAEKMSEKTGSKITKQFLKNKFHKCLQRLEIDSDIFLSGSREDKNKKGSYIFLALNAAELMEEFFEILEKKGGWILFKECERVIEILHSLLPRYKSEREILLIQANGKKAHNEINETEEHILDDISREEEHIIQAINQYYRKQLGEYFFKEALFLKFNKVCKYNTKRRHAFNRLQCEEVARWKQYWNNVFEEYFKFRIVEKYSMFLEHREKIGEENWIKFCLGNIDETQVELQKVYQEKRIGCKTVCNRIQNKEYEEITISIEKFSEEHTLKFCENEIKQLMKWETYLQKDFDVMIQDAFVDLENRYKILQKYNAIQADLEKLQEQCEFIKDIEIDYLKKIEECFESAIY